MNCVRFFGLVAIASVAVALSVSARAAVPEPDNIVYGKIALGNIQIPALRRDIVIEARRLINGAAIARYRMGDTLNLGDFYSLRIPLESAPSNTNSTTAGAGLFIVVLDDTGVRAQASFSVGNRATVYRLDLGGVLAGDGDTLPDAWEALQFGNLNQTPESINANGQTTLQNYISGANPHITNGIFTVSISSVNGNLRTVSFQAVRAAGIGYLGMSRYYSLEYSTNVGAAVWLGVEGFTDLLGSDQLVRYETSQTDGPVVYRGRVWLQGP